MDQEFNFFRDKKIIDAFKKEKPHLLYIEKIIQKIKYGRLTLVLRIHDSKVTDITTMSALRLRFDTGKGNKGTKVTVNPMNVNDAEKEINSAVGGINREGIS